MASRDRKKPSRRQDWYEVWRDELWRVKTGELRRRPGHPGRVSPLFLLVAEKLPYDSLDKVAKDLAEYQISPQGVYVAHDSMGCPRYIGRGHVINRLRARRKAQYLELAYFSFYLVREKIHEREIETLMIRSAGPLLHFNDRKKRVDISAGSIRDYEPGTYYYSRRANGWGTTRDQDAD